MFGRCRIEESRVASQEVVERQDGSLETPVALESSDRYLLDACVDAGRTLVGGEEIAVDRIDRIRGFPRILSVAE